MEAEVVEILNIQQVAERLGFTEIPELQTARAKWLEAIRSDTPNVTELAIRYADMAEAMDTQSSAEFQIGLMIAKAGVYRDAGKVEFYREDLEDALQYAYQMDLTDLVAQIGAELNRLG